MENRKRKVSIRKASGNASVGSKKYSIDLPSIWMQTMEITEEDREVEIRFNGKQIIISKK